MARVTSGRDDRVAAEGGLVQQRDDGEPETRTEAGAGGAESDELLSAIETEVAELRRRIKDAPVRVSRFEAEIADLKRDLAKTTARNHKLTTTVETARERIAVLREEVEKLSQPPSAYGTVIGLNDDGTADINSGGRKMRVTVHPDLADGLSPGQEVVLNESMSVILARPAEGTGEVVRVKELFDGGTRALVVGRADEELVVELPAAVARGHLRSGDSALIDPVQAGSSSDCPAPRWRASSWRRSLTSPTTTWAASPSR